MITKMPPIVTRDYQLQMIRVRRLFDGDPDGFTFVLGLDDFLFEAVEPDAAVEDFADFAVFTYEDAAFGVFRAVACVDADAFEFRNTEKDGKPLLELWREGDDYGVAAFWDGRTAFYLVGTVGVVAPSWFQCVAEIKTLPRPLPVMEGRRLLIR